MKKYILSRLEDLKAKLAIEYQAKAATPIEESLSFDSAVRNNVIMMYAFAICELEEILRNE